jgi:hypothetical protein
MTKMNLGKYFSEIGLRYLLIPIMAGAMGAVGSQQRQEHYIEMPLGSRRAVP